MKLTALIILGTYLLGIIFWIVNIFQVVMASKALITVVLALKVIGIFVPPLGAIMGFLGLFGI